MHDARPQDSDTARRTDARQFPHRSLLAAGIALALGSGSAQATVTLSFGDAQLDTAIQATAPGSTSYWTNYSENCSNVFGSTTNCDANARPAPNPSTMLFSWGTQNDTPNSVLQATYTGSGAQIASITLSSLEPGLGPASGPAETGPYTPPTGQGSMVVFEDPDGGGTDNGALNTQNASQQRVDIAVNGSAQLSDQLVLKGRGLVAGSPSSYKGGLPFPGLGSIVQYGFTSTFEFTSPITVSTNDVISFTFYESFWDNRTVGDDAIGAFPDAYYGAMDVTFTTPATPSELSVTPSPTLDLGSLRAGGTATSTGGLTAENVGGGTIAGSFDAPTGDTGEITFSDPSGAGFSLDAGGTDQRDYEFDTSGVALGVSDTAPETFTVTQGVTSDADTNPNPSRTVQGAAVGPVLGVSADNGATNLPYDQSQVIDLGTIDLASESTATEILLIRNLFGTDLGDALTSLTIANAGLTGAGAGAFSFNEADFATKVVLANGRDLSGGGSLADLDLLFDPSNVVGTYTATLYFLTDMNNAFSTTALEADCQSGSATVAEGCLRFTVTADAIRTGGGGAPAPASILLIGSGLLGLAGLRARRRPKNTA